MRGQSQDIFRKRFVEAMVFFARELRFPVKTTMWKVMAELDFRHLDLVGIPVTFARYDAYPHGAVPHDFHVEMTQKKDVELPEDMREALTTLREEYEIDGESTPTYQITFVAKRKPDLSIFTPRQTKLMRDLAFIYKNVTAHDAEKASHEPGKPWTITVNRKGEGARIEYLDLIGKDSKLSREESKEKMEEILAFHKNYLH